MHSKFGATIPTRESPTGRLLAQFSLQVLAKKGIAMTKTLEMITEAIRGSKHPFNKIENLPKKAQKHRYERRKIKECLHLSDRITEEAV